jgi:hypothetical protein
MKGFIYIIKSKNPDINDCYVGSTFNFSVRRSTHKYNCNAENKKPYNYKVYKFIRDNGGMDNFTFEILEEFEAETKKDLFRKEAQYANELKPSLNENQPYVEDYILYQRDYYKNKYTEYHKKRYQEKKEEYKQTNKDRYHRMKEIVKLYNENLNI